MIELKVEKGHCQSTCKGMGIDLIAEFGVLVGSLTNQLVSQAPAKIQPVLKKMITQVVLKALDTPPTESIGFDLSNIK